MIVVDASAVVEVLLNTVVGGDIADRLLDRQETIAAPHLLDLEVLQVLRRFALAGDLDAERAEQAITDFSDLAILRYAHEPLNGRIWDLRSNLTAYDAAYVALAEALDVPLLTRDACIARSPGHGARVELV